MKKAHKTIKKAVRISKAKNKSKSSKHAKSRPKPLLNDIDNKISAVLGVEKNILNEEKRVEQKEESIKKEESEVEGEEKRLEKIEEKTEKTSEKEDEDLKKLEQLEQDIKKEVGAHPLAKITLRDIVKGLVGAFVGLAVHYTFTYGVEISQRIDLARITLLYVLAFFIGLLFIYATGFRKIKDPKILMFMPLRLMVLYTTALVMSIVVLFVFYPEFGKDLITSYKMVGGVLLAAVIGSCTADLIGKD